jgi:hypothetical protein
MGPNNTPRRSNDGRKTTTTSSNSCDGRGGLETIDKLFAAKKSTEKLKRAAEQSPPSTKRAHNYDVKNEKVPSKKGRKYSPNSSNRTTRISETWTDDGLGGQYNEEGFTGRVEEGMKIFKAHLLNKPDFGKTRDCPFDCDCCFI